MRGNGTGSVYRDPSKRRHLRPWAAVVTVALDEHHRPVRVARFASSEEAAWELLAKLRREHHLGVDVEVAGAPLRLYLADWLAGVSRGLAPRTVDSYASRITVHIAPAIGHIALGKLRPIDVRRMIAAHSGSSRTKTLSLVILRMALRQAVTDGIIERDPTAGIKPPRRETREVHPLTADEARRLLAATAEDPLGPLFALALATGARQGELLGLTWDDVDLAAARLTIRYALAHLRAPGADGPTEPVRVEPKTAASRRTVVLPAFAVAALRRHKARQAALQLAAGRDWRDADLVFTRDDGEPMWGSTVTRHLADVLAGAGLPAQRFHDLRHFAATELVGRSGDLKMTQAVLGHATIGVTADVYAHRSEDALRRAAAIMDEALGRPTADTIADTNGGKA